MNIEQKLCKEKIFSSNVCPLSNAIICLDKRFTVKNSGHCISCLTLIFNLSYQTTTIMQATNLSKVAGHDNSHVLFLCAELI